ncbi:hypothetical protein N9850_14385 [Granulosicoccus sp.]|nr:hypothetical protein [Granulosicoccus sp.]MDB4224949.1 hypothetical protein [Granulosicoccus sp.]
MSHELETRLIAPTYTPSETIEIINDALNPMPTLTLESLAQLVSLCEIKLQATSDKDTVDVVEHGEVLILQYHLIITKSVHTYRQAIERFQSLRSLRGIPTYRHDGALVEVPLLWDASFSRESILEFILSRSTDSNILQTKQETKDLVRQMYKRMLDEDPRLNKDSAAPTIAQEFNLSVTYARRLLQGQSNFNS